MLSSPFFVLSAAKECPPLSAPANGTLNLTGTTFGSLAEYSCDLGFVLAGTEVRMCQASGAWSGAPARCESEFSEGSKGETSIFARIDKHEASVQLEACFT